ncbi:MAG: hypothetical protein WC184_02550 [Acidimicrobiia bacterium]
METRRWTNPSLPPTLQIAVFLLYATAFITFLLPPSIYHYLGSRIGAPNLVGALAVVGLVAGAFGIANERRWGYQLSLAVTGAAILELLLILLQDGIGYLLNANYLMLALFPVVRFALLVHPISREHQRVWFH